MRRLDEMRRQHLGYARDNLGRALLTLGRLEKANPGIPALRQLRNHLEVVRDSLREEFR